MTDKPVVHIGENSPEQVAYKLMERIFDTEGRSMYAQGQRPVTRQEVLETYRECRRAVYGMPPR